MLGRIPTSNFAGRSRVATATKRGLAFPARAPSARTMAASKATLGPVRNLHWVFKVGDRTATAEFYQDLMGMESLRHEEFIEGCAAACNGPYDGKWSKTMIGYGEEDTNFVLELTYNYTVRSYELGNDFNSITIKRKATFEKLKEKGVGHAVHDGKALEVAAPGGYKFVVVDEDVAGCPVTQVAINVQDLQKSLAYWSGFLGFSIDHQSDTEAVVSCAPGGAKLRLVQLPAGQAINRGTAYGRIAFATAGALLQQLESDVKAAGYTVHTPYVSLDTPGKATVQVVILQDPDGHEICFVGDEGFRDLSQRDPAGPQLLADAIAADKSSEWLERRAQMEAAMAAKGV